MFFFVVNHCPLTYWACNHLMTLPVLFEDTTCTWYTRLLIELYAAIPLCAGVIAMLSAIAHVRWNVAARRLLRVMTAEHLTLGGELGRIADVRPNGRSAGASLIWHQRVLDAVPVVTLGIMVVAGVRACMIALLGVDSPILVALCSAITIAPLVAMVANKLTLSHTRSDACHLLERLCRLDCHYRVTSGRDGAIWQAIIYDHGSDNDNNNRQILFPDELLVGSPVYHAAPSVAFAAQAWKISMDDAYRVLKAAGGHFPHIILVRALLANMERTARPEDVVQCRKKLVKELIDAGRYMAASESADSDDSQSSDSRRNHTAASSSSA